MHATLEKQHSELERGPLSDTQMAKLSEAIQDLTPDQLYWCSGYLAGIVNPRRGEAEQPHQAAVTLLYASHTGNGKGIAERLATAFSEQGVKYQLLPVAEYRPRDLGKAQTLILVVSTHGEGEPPESAAELYRYLHSKRAPRLDSLSYAVFGLGDSSYEHFCKAARDFDERLLELGAKRLMGRVEADVDFHQSGERWVGEIQRKIGAQRPLARLIPMAGTQKSQASRDRPQAARLLERRPLTTSDALSEVHHLVLEGDHGVLSHQPGDSLGVWFSNDPRLVEQILSATRINDTHPVTLGEKELSIGEALVSELELTQLHPSAVKKWAQLEGSKSLGTLIENRASLRDYCSRRQVIDLLLEYPAEIDAQTLAQVLLPLQPRFYSIASSPLAYDDEIHLTVSVVSYRAQGKPRIGGASGFLGRRLEEDESLRVFVAENSAFRLPESSDTATIMIAAGTGVAPYRAFLQHRSARADSGSNWLFSGNRHFHRDFLYQREWLALREQRVLHSVSPAFSRDSTNRGYVQDRLLESSCRVYDWLEEGAHMYICGGAAMASGVEAALHKVITSVGGKRPEQAAEYIQKLRLEGRLQRDIY